MIDWIYPLILAVIQGFTEWLPISSSGHLLLFEKIFGYSGGLAFEVALHFGTLIAVFIYFSKDIVAILRDFASGRFNTLHGKMGIWLLVGTLPAVFFGVLARNYFDTVLSDLILLAMGFLVTGVLLLIVGFTYSSKNKSLNLKTSLIIGFAQAAAIIPSISRSGATIASGVLSGLDEKLAMKFSFLLSIPAILGASIFEWGVGSFPAEFVVPTIVSFLVGLGSIHLCFKYLLVKRENFKWFGFYCLIVALVILTWTFLVL